jgi:radical SAM protein with 4Fe4S-binding SPASM domain
MDTNKFYCGGIVCVTVDGDVTPCSVIRKGYGNIRDDPLDVIVDTHRRELLYIPLRHKSGLPNGCIGCSNTGVCWGCRAAAYCETGDIFGMDPKCYNASREFGK